MFNFSEGNSFEDILARCLDRIPENLDKREGSIIYDALAPACAELAQLYIALDVYADQTYLLNATGENLDNKVVDYGLTRNAATYSYRIGIFTDALGNDMTIELGTRFSVPNEYGGYNYKVTELYEPGKYILKCETAGTVGNEYHGILLPLVSVNNLGSAVLDEIYIAGEDEEDDESLRKRAILKLTETPFGGNIADYTQYVESIDGVGACLVIPAWNGGGTVKLVIVTNSYTIPTSNFIRNIQELIDPSDKTGQGLGKAPIGHEVTVVAPQAYNININATVELVTGYTLPTLLPEIEQVIADYIKEIQKSWSSSDLLTIYYAKLIAAILSVEGTANVSALTINGQSLDITIDVSSINNPFPILSEVVIHEG